MKFNRKLLSEFKETPLLEKTAFVTKNAETLIEAALFEQCLTLLEQAGPEILKKKAGQSKYNAFLKELKQLKSLPSQIEKNKKLKAEKSAEDQIRLERAKSEEKTKKEWLDKVELFKQSLIEELNQGIKITHKRHWALYSNLMDQKPELLKNIQAQSYQNFIRGLSEYSKDHKAERRARFKKLIEESAKKRQGFKWGKIILATILLGATIYKSKDIKNWYEEKQLQKNIETESKKLNQYTKYIQKNQEAFIKLVTKKDQLNADELKLFNQYLEAAFYRFDPHGNEKKGILIIIDTEINALITNIEIIDKNINRVLELVQSQEKEEQIKKQKTAKLYLELITSCNLILRSYTEKIQTHLEINKESFFKILKQQQQYLKNLAQVHPSLAKNAIETFNQVESLESIYSKALATNKYGHLNKASFENIRKSFYQSLQKDSLFEQAYLARIYFQNFMAQVNLIHEIDYELSLSEKKDKTTQNIVRRNEAMLFAISELHFIENNKEKLIKVLKQTDLNDMHVLNKKVEIDEKIRGEFLFAMVNMVSYQTLWLQNKNNSGWREKALKYEKELDILNSDLSESGKQMVSILKKKYSL